ncbi:hypothetical protein TWF718_007763 [Orbilia javanica]|uniref:Uncharacterized protein n=1 Tax=Orbilia javanica TaxID=47235 RepID=A0AAN8MV29_9PEZI
MMFRHSSGTGFLHPRSLTLFFSIFLVFGLYSKTVLAAPVVQQIDRRDASASILCTESSTTLSKPYMSTVTDVLTIIETTFSTQTNVIITTIVGGTTSGSIAETTSTLTTVQTGVPVVSETNTEPGYIVSTPGYTTSWTSRPAITMIASPPVATNQPEERPVSSSGVLTPTTLVYSNSSTTASLPLYPPVIPTTSIESTPTIPSNSTITSSTYIISIPIPSTATALPQEPTTSLPEEPTTMASNILVPIETVQPSVDRETVSTPSQDPPKTGYLLTGIVIPQPSETVGVESMRIEINIAMPTSTAAANRDLNQPPEVFYRGGAGRGIAMSIGVWGVTGIVAMVLGVVV